jgi:hypothetical protein
MKKDSVSGVQYATQKAKVKISDGNKFIVISDKLDRKEFTNDIYEYVENERKEQRTKGIITEIKFLDCSVIEI